jgi:hypothetical protein
MLSTIRKSGAAVVALGALGLGGARRPAARTTTAAAIVAARGRQR